MSDMEKRLHDAFEQMEPPAGLNERTLERIEQVRSDIDQNSGAPEARIPVIHSESATPDAPAPRKRGFSVVKKSTMLAAAAACLVFAVLGVFAAGVYSKPTAYIDIDMNPSVELAVNRFDRVLSASGINDDGRAVANAAPVVGMSYSEALEAIFTSPDFTPFVRDDSFVQVSVVSDDASQEQAIVGQSNACLRELPCEGACAAASSEHHAAASAAGMGVGRYLAAMDLLAVDESLTLEECSHMSMRELRDRTAAHHSGDTGPDGKDHGQERGQGGGYQGQGYQGGGAHGFGSHGQGGSGSGRHHSEHD